MVGKSYVSSQHREQQLQQQHQATSKSIIARDKLSDNDFDKLVMETLQRISQKVEDQVLFEQQERRRETKCLSSVTEDCGGSGSGSGSSSGTVERDEESSCSAVSSSLNQPKRPMNAFMVWGQAIRRELHDKFSNVQNALLSKALGRVWRTLDASQKEPYVKKANLIKADHKLNYPNYRYRPRRIQERRLKCNMLIGIQLDHPVNHQPSPGRINCFSAVTVTDNNQRPDQYSHPNKTTVMTTTYDTVQSRDQVWHNGGHNNHQGYHHEAINRLDQRAQIVDGVQKFEFQPYPYNSTSIQTTSSAAHNTPRFVSDLQQTTIDNTTSTMKPTTTNTLNNQINNNNTNQAEMRNSYRSNCEATVNIRHDVDLNSNEKTSTTILPQPDFSYSQTYHTQFFYGQMQHHHHQPRQQSPSSQQHQFHPHPLQHNQHYQAALPTSVNGESQQTNCLGEANFNNAQVTTNGYYHTSYNKPVNFEQRFV